jgi:hypothetical protein
MLPSKRKLARAFDFWTAVLAGAAGVLFLAFLIISVPRYQVRQDLRAGRITQSEIPQQVDAYRRTIIQLAGGLVVAIGLYLTWRRIEVTERRVAVSEEGQVTDRFSTAIEQLGDDRLEVRLGGIYALERIAKDSPKDHWTVMETLSAFVRENASSTREGEDSEDEATSPKDNSGPRTDVQAACTVIGRRKTDQDPEGEFVDLTRARLAGIHLLDADLSGANLQHADLSGAALFNADLSETIVHNTDLSGAHLKGATLSGALLTHADLSRKADLRNVDLSGADLMFADLGKARNLSISALCEAQTLYGATLEPGVEEAVLKQCPKILDHPNSDSPDASDPPDDDSTAAA